MKTDLENDVLAMRAEAVSISKMFLATAGKILRDDSITPSELWRTIHQFDALREAAERGDWGDEAAWYRLTLRYLHQELNRRIKVKSMEMQ